MATSQERWLDSEAGPVVRPYALIRGRTRHSGEKFDLVATVTAVRAQIGDRAGLAPEQLAILAIARRPTTVADLASELDLPLGVVRVLLADLRDLGLLTIRAPASSGEDQGRHVLREVLNGLRRL